MTTRNLRAAYVSPFAVTIFAVSRSRLQRHPWLWRRQSSVFDFRKSRAPVIWARAILEGEPDEPSSRKITRVCRIFSRGGFGGGDSLRPVDDRPRRDAAQKHVAIDRRRGLQFPRRGAYGTRRDGGGPVR